MKSGGDKTMAISMDTFRLKNGRNYVVKIDRYVTSVAQKYKTGSSHTPSEINFFFSGSGKYKIGTRTYEFKEGDIFFIPPSVSHLITERYEDTDHLNIWFVPDSLGLDSGKNPNAFNDIFARIKTDEKIHFDTSHSFYRTLKTIIMHIYDEVRSKKTGYAQLVQLKLAELTLQLVREFECSVGDVNISPNPQTEAIDNTLEYIQGSVKKNFTLAELAKVANMSPSHFGAVFKEINGITPWEYITSKKMELAKSLLKDKTKSVGEVIAECGYTSTANFNRAFKIYTGITPREYRKK